MTAAQKTYITFRSDTFNRTEQRDYFGNQDCFGDDVPDLQIYLCFRARCRQDAGAPRASAVLDVALRASASSQAFRQDPSPTGSQVICVLPAVGRINEQLNDSLGGIGRWAHSHFRLLIALHPHSAGVGCILECFLRFPAFLI